MATSSFKKVLVKTSQPCVCGFLKPITKENNNVEAHWYLVNKTHQINKSTRVSSSCIQLVTWLLKKRVKLFFIVLDIDNMLSYGVRWFKEKKREFVSTLLVKLLNQLRYVILLKLVTKDLTGSNAVLRLRMREFAGDCGFDRYQEICTIGTTIWN